MPSTRNLSISVLALAWASLNPLSARAEVIVTGGKLYSQAHQSGFSGAQTFTLPKDSLHLTTSASIGGNSGSTAYDFTVSGNSGHIQSNFTDTRAGAVYAPFPGASSAADNYGFIFIEVTSAPAFYTMTGEFDLRGGGINDFHTM